MAREVENADDRHALQNQSLVDPSEVCIIRSTIAI